MEKLLVGIGIMNEAVKSAVVISIIILSSIEYGHNETKNLSF